MRKSEIVTQDALKSLIVCHKCGEPMRKISWKVTAGSYDAGKEVEQLVFECSNDKNTLCIEVTTGEPSEFSYDHMQ
jgi:uncharacterized Fe-S cluster-containing radical SAM superfamily protein